jgi:hypothetical protein
MMLISRIFTPFRTLSLNGSLKFGTSSRRQSYTLQRDSLSVVLTPQPQLSASFLPRNVVAHSSPRAVLVISALSKPRPSHTRDVAATRDLFYDVQQKKGGRMFDNLTAQRQHSICDAMWVKDVDWKSKRLGSLLTVYYSSFLLIPRQFFFSGIFRKALLDIFW